MTDPVPGQTPEPAAADGATTTPPPAREPEPEPEPEPAERVAANQPVSRLHPVSGGEDLLVAHRHVAARAREGARLSELIQQRCEQLGAQVKRVRERLPEVHAAIRARFRRNVAQLCTTRCCCSSLNSGYIGSASTVIASPSAIIRTLRTVGK